MSLQQCMIHACPHHHPLFTHRRVPAGALAYGDDCSIIYKLTRLLVLVSLLAARGRIPHRTSGSPTFLRLPSESFGFLRIPSDSFGFLRFPSVSTMDWRNLLLAAVSSRSVCLSVMQIPFRDRDGFSLVQEHVARARICNRIEKSSQDTWCVKLVWVTNARFVCTHHCPPS
jgi:hypothetical protein